MTSRRRGVGLTPMETRRDVIVATAVLAVAATLWLTVPHPGQAPAVQATARPAES